MYPFPTVTSVQKVVCLGNESETYYMFTLKKPHSSPSSLALSTIVATAVSLIILLLIIRLLKPKLKR